MLTDPQVPEKRRFCGKCDNPVGRGRDGSPGRTEGFCPHCGTSFSFEPRLERGEMVAGQYEVTGCLAHGGLGWIYLGVDHNLGKRWVVLKGLLNTSDPAAIEAAVAERRFLAEVKHPNIVGVYNFVQHPDRRTGEPAGYIVMEYVGGRSLKEILADRHKAGESLPLPVALAYAVEVLPALGHLHSRGLVYCDFKPDNAIQTEEQLKLIDMGGVRRIDDQDSAIYGTRGYQAREIEDVGPSPSYDLYTVGRALAVMTFKFDYQGKYVYTLPDPATVPVLAANESFLRALLRATDPDPGRRFASAAEMAEQLTGVLREVLSAGDGQPRATFSTLFTPEVQAIGAPDAALSNDTAPVLPVPPAAELIAGLPLPVVDSDDPAAGFLATLGTVDPAQRISTLTGVMAGQPGIPAAVTESAETRFALVRALITDGDPAAATSLITDAAAADPGDWRVSWYRGLHDLATGNPPGARDAFDVVLAALPGAPAAKLALGLTAEAAGEPGQAAGLLRVVWTVDRSFVSAAFGLARVCLTADDREGAIAVLTAVPETSSRYVAAQVAAVRIRLSPPSPGLVSADDLHKAGQQVGKLQLDAAARHRLTAAVLRAALNRLQAGQTMNGGRLAGHETSERAVRLGLEDSYRAQAKLAPDRGRRIELVDLANEFRPRTWS
jgi:serine/threonine-protein kinase PknG